MSSRRLIHRLLLDCTVEVSASGGLGRPHIEKRGRRPYQSARGIYVYQLQHVVLYSTAFTKTAVSRCP